MKDTNKVKHDIHHNSMQDQQMTTSDKIEVDSCMVNILSKVTLEIIRRAGEEDVDISRVVHHVKLVKT